MLVRDMNMHRCQQNRTLILFMLMIRTRSKRPNSCEQVVTSNDDADAVDEGLPRHSQRTSSPPIRMTYDVPGQPSFQPWTTVGVQGISASYPQQILPPYRVPWMFQPVWKPCCQCFVYMYLPLQSGPMTHAPYCY